MLYLNDDNIIIPKINAVEGDKIKFVNQVTKDVLEADLSLDGNYYVLETNVALTGQYDYFIYAGNSPLDILLTGIASSLTDRENTSYSSNINIKTYNG